METPSKQKPEDFRCDVCQKGFSTKGSLTRHQNDSVCLKNSGVVLEPNIPVHVTDERLNSEIINCVGDKYLQFICAQRLGVYKKQLYPLCFLDDGDNSLSGLKDDLPVGKHESVKILTLTYYERPIYVSSRDCRYSCSKSNTR